MTNVLMISLIVVAILLILVILVQSRGSGLSATFGGEGNVYRSKRGVEKTLSTLTVVLAILFVILAFLLPLWDKLVVYFA